MRPCSPRGSSHSPLPPEPGSRLSGVIARYSRPEMNRIWSEEGRLARWFEVELAALDGWVEVGAVPASDVAAIRDRAEVPTPERVAEIEQATDHDLAAFVDAVAEQLGPEGRWVHYGLTSSDVVDTSLALQIRDAGALILRGRRRRPPGRGAPRQGASADDLHRAIPRHPRRADDLRVETRGLGVRARPRPHTARAGARDVPCRPALGHGRDVRRRSIRTSNESPATASASSPTRSRRR